MQGIMRQILTVALSSALSAAVVAALLITADVNAQDPSASAETTSSTSEPVSVADTTVTFYFIHYQGQAFNPNTQQPLANATLSAQFTLYRDFAETQPVWSESKSISTNIDGLFNTNLGDTVPFNLSIFNGEILYLGVILNGEAIRPPQPIGYVPYAIYASNAANANTLDGIDSNQFARVIAYGFVDDDGERESGTPGWRSSIQTIDQQRVYVIDIDNVDYRFRDFTTVVTPACGRAVTVGTGSSQGDLLVDVFDLAGNHTTCEFQFAVFRRP